ncbi:MAG: type II toxin-antitoxin system RelE/ParE family toxin [Bacteroidetes bacterium]|nr:type II toxin-antitoxin system RelE/ParE family toxin [Bacteroidota bacterium]
MNYQVLVEKRIEKQISRIPHKDYVKIKEAILSLAKNPRPFGFKKLSAREGYRMRVGDYRIIYQIEDRQFLVIILSVGNRKDIYN